MVHAASCVCGFTARDSGSGEVVAFDMCRGEMGESRAHLSVKQSGRKTWKTVRITESYQGRKVTVSSRTGLFSNVYGLFGILQGALGVVPTEPLLSVLTPGELLIRSLYSGRRFRLGDELDCKGSRFRPGPH